MPRKVSRTEIADIVRELNTGGVKMKFQDVEEYLAGLGNEIEPPPQALSTRGRDALPPPAQRLSDNPALLPSARLGAMAIDEAPSLGAFGLSGMGMAVGGPAGGMAGAIAGGMAGRAIQRGAYSLAGLAPPPKGMGAQLLGSTIPGFSGVPDVMQEGASQLAQELVGQAGMQALRYSGKKLAEISVGNADLRYDPAKTAVREGISLSRRGIAKIRNILGELAPEVNRVLDSSPLRAGGQPTEVINLSYEMGTILGKDEIVAGPGVWFERDIVQPSVDRIMETVGKGKTTEGEVAIRKILRKMFANPQNQGSLSARRLHQLSLPGPGVAGVLRGRTKGITPDAGEMAYWKKVVDEQISNQARRVLHEAHPDAAEILERESQLLHLSNKVSNHIKKPGGTLAMEYAAAAGVGAGASQLFPAKNRNERARNALFGLVGGGLGSNPELMKILANAFRQTPRILEGAVPDDTLR